MSDIQSYGYLPGTGAIIQTNEAAVWSGRETAQEFGNMPIASASVDAGSSPTTYLRAGLVMGKITATGLLTQYSPTATDGSQVAYCVLAAGISMLNNVGVAAITQGHVILKGILQGANLIGIDSPSRRQLLRSGRFCFDDDMNPGSGFLGHPKQEINKAADYTVVAADNGTLFTASAAVNFTLPALTAGLAFEFLNLADSNMTITSAEGDNIVWDNDAACDSLAFSTASHKIGGHLRFRCNVAGTKWYVDQLGPSTCTVTVAT